MIKSHQLVWVSWRVPSSCLHLPHQERWPDLTDKNPVNTVLWMSALTVCGAPHLNQSQHYSWGFGCQLCDRLTSNVGRHDNDLKADRTYPVSSVHNISDVLRSRNLNGLSPKQISQRLGHPAVFLKSTVLPWESVHRPSSRIWRSRLKTWSKAMKQNYVWESMWMRK